MATYSDLIKLVAPMAPGAPDPAVETAVRLGAIEFCRRTLTLQRTLAPVNTVIGQSDYTLTQVGEVVTKLLSVKADGKPLELVVSSVFDDTETPQPADRPTAAALAGPMLLRVFPTPTVAGLPIVARAAMMPSQASTTFADDLLETNAQAIADYAIYWLLGQPKAAYYAPREADAAMARFLDAVGSEREVVFTAASRSSSRPRILWM